MVGQYKVITLCGSTRFKDAFIETQKRLTLYDSASKTYSYFQQEDFASAEASKGLCGHYRHRFE